MSYIGTGAQGVSRQDARGSMLPRHLLCLCCVIGLARHMQALRAALPSAHLRQGHPASVSPALLTAAGFSNLEGVDLRSERNIFILGFGLYCGLSGAPPSWAAGGREAAAAVPTFQGRSPHSGPAVHHACPNAAPAPAYLAPPSRCVPPHPAPPARHVLGPCAACAALMCGMCWAHAPPQCPNTSTPTPTRTATAPSTPAPPASTT